jgi:CDP-glycerol glycerophosphotransferase (TagB/SpsB family)
MLDTKITEGAFFKPLQILARFHPKYTDSSEGLSSPNIVFHRPGTYFKNEGEFSIDSSASANKWTFRDADIIHLANSLKHADIVLSVDSTLTLDAAAVGRPSILVGYDGDRTLPYKRSIAYIYERDHYRNVMKTGAAPLARSHEELVRDINQFLKDPDYLQKERDILVRDLLYKVDGQSGKRMGDAVLGMLA